MLVMLRNYSPVKKIIAAFLPVCFLWSFAACVSICADESAENHLNHSVTTTTADASTSDFCSMTDAPDAAFPERTIFDFQISAVVRRSIFTVETSTFVVAEVSQRRGKPPFADPPLKRLPVLRI